MAGAHGAHRGGATRLALVAAPASGCHGAAGRALRTAAVAAPRERHGGRRFGAPEYAPAAHERPRLLELGSRARGGAVRRPGAVSERRGVRYLRRPDRA